MKRILFVDDDVAVLEGLRLRLRGMQHQWIMTFANSGGQALDEFQRQPYNVIVSDVRIPGILGTRLLRTVSERWPEAVRIALSGLTDPQEALRLAPIAHQFLSKPCESPLLEEVIERCLALQDLLHQPALRAIQMVNSAFFRRNRPGPPCGAPGFAWQPAVRTDAAHRLRPNRLAPIASQGLTQVA